MKKKVFALALAATLTFSSAVPALASGTTATPAPTTAAASGKLSSPEQKVTITPRPTTITPRPTITKRVTLVPSRTSPKTGQMDYVLYGVLGAAAFGSVVVVSKKKKDEA